MYLKSLLLLTCASPVLSFFSLNWFSEADFVVTPANTPFASLDHGVNFYFQYDGNFVVYQHGSMNVADALWASYTGGVSCWTIKCKLVFQSDGNLVIYQNGAAVWNTETTGRGEDLTIWNILPYVEISNHRGDTVWSALRPCSGGECIPLLP